MTSPKSTQPGAQPSPPSIIPFAVMCVGMFVALLDIQIVASSLQDIGGVLSAGRDTCVRVCQVADGKEVAVAGTPRGGQSKDWISAFALSPDERTLAAADIAGLIQVWEFGA